MLSDLRSVSLQRTPVRAVEVLGGPTNPQRAVCPCRSTCMETGILLHLQVSGPTLGPLQSKQERQKRECVFVGWRGGKEK